MAIFAIPSFTRGSTIALLYFLGMTSVWVLVALYLQIGTGKSDLQTALVGVPAALTAAVAASWAARRVDRRGRQLVIGVIVLVALVFAVRDRREAPAD
ncbi:hypothetical protein [Janibacter hoylei]|uniref:hypothetical protein n=1 Tax=Janibacter hoylei TaxID=364298 RepID=UPI000FE3929A|nr:hypothetical protein [Janibacter hoylei]